MSIRRQVTLRFLAWLLFNLAFIAISLLFLKPHDIPIDRELVSDLIQVMFVGSLLAFGMIYCSIKYGDEAFSRRLVASIIVTFLIFLMFDHFISEHLLRFGNPILSGMLTFWAIMIAVNVASQALHRLSPSNFR
jgi:hypothetical protein